MSVCWPYDAANGPRVPPALVLGRDRSALWNHCFELGDADADAAAVSTPILMKVRFTCDVLTTSTLIAVKVRPASDAGKYILKRC